MVFAGYFGKKPSKTTSAQMAKERLKVVIAHERAARGAAPVYLEQMRDEILDVVRKYVAVGDDQVRFDIERDGEMEILEVNVTIPEPSANIRQS